MWLFSLNAGLIKNVFSGISNKTYQMFSKEMSSHKKALPGFPRQCFSDRIMKETESSITNIDNSSECIEVTLFF